MPALQRVALRGPRAVREPRSNARQSTCSTVPRVTRETTRHERSPFLSTTSGPALVALACLVVLLLFDENRSAPWWAYVLLLGSALAWGGRALFERRRAPRRSR